MGKDLLKPLNLITKNGVYTTSGDASTNVVPYITGFIDLTPVKNVYLHCNEISNFNQLTVRVIQALLKRYP